MSFPFNCRKAAQGAQVGGGAPFLRLLCLFAAKSELPWDENEFAEARQPPLIMGMKVTRMQIIRRGLTNRCPNCGAPTMSSLITPAVGTVAALCSMSSFAPQIAKIWRDRDAAQVSLVMYLVTVTGFGLWSAYGILEQSWPVTVSNLVCLGMAAAVLALKWRFSRGRSAGVCARTLVRRGRRP